jgi:hypothetical protein
MIQQKPKDLRPLSWILLNLLVVFSMAGVPAAQTAWTAGNPGRHQSIQSSIASTKNFPDPSNLGAMSANIDATVERRVDADAEAGITDPGLMPLRIITPNINGEDEPQVPTSGDGNRGGQLSVFTRSRSAANRGENPSSALSLRTSRCQGSLARRQSLAIHSSNTKLPLDNSSPYPVMTSSASGSRKRMRRNSVTRGPGTPYPQQLYRRDCTKMYLDELECMTNLKRRHSLSRQHDTTLTSQKSWVFLR